MNTDVFNSKPDELEIRRMMSAWSAALEAKDVDGLVTNYAPDAVLFDAIPPYKQEGVGGIREVWEHCLPFFPETFKSEHRDVTIHVQGDTAFAHALHHIVTDGPEQPGCNTWLRVSIGYRRIGGSWKVVHEHVSAPFNPMNNKVWNITDPDTLDQPDYSEGCNEAGEL